MKKNISLLVILVIAGFFITENSLADEVRLKNADKLTGRIVRMQENKLTLKTTYAGEITISWKEVAGLRTDGLVKVVLEDNTRFEGTAEAIEDGKMTLEIAKLETPASFRMADVKAITPVPDKTVKITGRANVSITNQRAIQVRTTTILTVNS
jgi:ribosome maturation factor RimP